MAERDHLRHRLQRSKSASLHHWQEREDWRELEAPPASDVVVECGWGRLIFGQTFREASEVANLLRAEQEGRRDIALYLVDPHVAIAHAPQEVFLDPSHTFRLWFERYRPSSRRPQGFSVRLLQTREDAEASREIYLQRKMVPPPSRFIWENRASKILTYLVAEDEGGNIIGTVTGVDHFEAFTDPENGASLWALAVDPQTRYPGVGEALVRHLAEYYLARGRAFMDLSVMHDNEAAISLYERLAFVRVPVFALKHKNPWNEPLYMSPQPDAQLNPYAMIIIHEARRRGIGVEVLDPEAAYFSLGFGGRTVVCRESLSELTSAVAMSRCDDKAVTSRLLTRAGLRVPRQILAGDEAEARAFLTRHERIVVKPARGEQGLGITVDVRDWDSVSRAIQEAKKFCDRVVLEEFVEGQDLRIVVIDFKVIAGAVRCPASIVGDGQHTVAELIEKQSRRRGAATGGESQIPLDAETERCVRDAGQAMDRVLPAGQELQVRKTANLHTGGTIHDVTARLSLTLCQAAVDAARAIDIPVVGLDFLVPRVDGKEYVIVEANERPGLANHEPQPTAAAFIDLLFPQTMRR